MSARGLYWVNWKNPMLLGDEHLRANDVAGRRAMGWLARAAAAPGAGFGLLAPGPGAGPALRWTPEQGADRLGVHVHGLSGLAPDGTPLFHDEQAFGELAGQLRGNTVLERNPPRPQRIAVVVEPADPEGIDPSGWIEVGTPDPREEPPRVPFRVPSLRVVLEVDGFSSGSRLKIGELIWDGIAVEPSADYLPAAVSTAATPGWEQACTRIRRAIRLLRERLVAASANPPSAGFLDETVLMAAAIGVAGTEDQVPAMAADVSPRAVFDAVVRVLRVGLTALQTRPAAYEHAQRELIQPGKLKGGDTHWFESLRNVLDEPYDHDRAGALLAQGERMLGALGEVFDHLLGAAPTVEAAPDPDLFFWREKRYKLTKYTARTVDCDEAWHSCFLRELKIEGVKSVLVVLDTSLLVSNPRPNAGLWMIDKYEPVKANMLRVDVDRDASTGKVVIHYPHISEPTVSAISLASRGLLDFAALGPDPDDRVRVYTEVA